MPGVFRECLHLKMAFRVGLGQCGTVAAVEPRLLHGFAVGIQNEARDSRRPHLSGGRRLAGRFRFCKRWRFFFSGFGWDPQAVLVCRVAHGYLLGIFFWTVA